MGHRYLEVTFRDGRPIAAYLYLPRKSGDRSARTERREEGLLIDYSADGRPIGIEITAPSRVSLQAINSVMTSLRQAPVENGELGPLAAA